MNYQSYKGRSIDFTKQVKIYKNLHNGLFSVMQNNLVVAHIESFKMSSVIFKVNESGRQRVIHEKKKNVHAFICGLLQDVNCDIDNVPKVCISYNPYKYDYFYFKDSLSKVILQSFEIVLGHNKQGMYLI